MIVQSMNITEIVREVLNDKDMVLRKLNHLIKDAQREYLKKGKKPLQRIIDYTPKSKNNWMLIYGFEGKKYYYFYACLYLMHDGLHAIMISKDGAIDHITPHFLIRYAQRFEDRGIRSSKKDILIRYILNNEFFVCKIRDNKFFSRSMQGVVLGDQEYVNLTKVMHFNTFITNKMIHEGQYEDFRDTGWDLLDYYVEEYGSDRITITSIY